MATRMRTLATGALLALSLGAAALTYTARAADAPAVLQTLQDKGIGDLKEFEATSANGMRAYVGNMGGDPMAVYVLPDGSAIVGTRISADGKPMDLDKMQEVASKSAGDAWKQLEQAHWIEEGSPKADRVVYVFSDPNCIWCHRFWMASRPWVQAEKVRIRYVMVGIIRADSPAKAAAIIKSSSPADAMEENESKFDEGGIKPLAEVPDDVRQQLQTNLALMSGMGFRGTPAIVFQNEDGEVERLAGLPQGERLNDVLGPM